MITKGSGPTHSVAIDPTTNRISTSGYTYDNNGNMTQMPQLTMSYDVANRMVSSNHASAGTQVYGYNHANQRVFVRNGNTVTYYLYGLGGERLMEFQETCTSGACSGYTETQRWIYFAGRKMFQKTGTTLKAITPNRLASEAKHFPYGETDGPPPTDTKDYFATYRRDTTGLDYAWNRYYSPTMGRFTTADPYLGSVRISNPDTWNRYRYARSHPVSITDSTGLDECGDDPYVCNVFDYLGLIRWIGSGGGGGSPNTPSLEAPPVTDIGALQVGTQRRLPTLAGLWQSSGSAFDIAMKVLSNVVTGILANRKCEEWLRQVGTPNEISAASFRYVLLRLLSAGESARTVGVASLDSGSTAIAAFHGGHGQIVGLPLEAMITINVNGAFFHNVGRVGPGHADRNGVVVRPWEGGTEPAQRQILLHEIGHIFMVLSPDFSDPTATMRNESAVDENCGAIVRSRGGRR